MIEMNHISISRLVPWVPRIHFHILEYSSILVLFVEHSCILEHITGGLVFSRVPSHFAVKGNREHVLKKRKSKGIKVDIITNLYQCLVNKKFVHQMDLNFPLLPMIQKRYFIPYYFQVFGWSEWPGICYSWWLMLYHMLTGDHCPWWCVIGCYHVKIYQELFLL